MEIFDNITKIVRGDLKDRIKPHSQVAIAAACFSMYAYKELKTQLERVDSFRFIFTSPTFIQEKAEKQKREFYIPRLSRENSLYGTEFEIKLRNEMTQNGYNDKNSYNQVANYAYLDTGVNISVLAEQLPKSLFSAKDLWMKR